MIGRKTSEIIVQRKREIICIIHAGRAGRGWWSPGSQMRGTRGTRHLGTWEDAAVISPPTAQLRLNLHGPFDSGCIMTEARPCPILRLLDQAADHGIAMHIAKLLDALLFVIYVEVVITGLPERAFLALNRSEERRVGKEC